MTKNTRFASTGNKKKQGGYTIAELVVGVGIVSLLIIIAFAALPTVNFKINSSRLASDVNSIRGEVVAWKGYGRPSYDTIKITTLCSASRKALPTSICGASSDGKSANPFGGDYTVTVNKLNKGRFDITVTNVPSDKLDILADQFAPQTAGSCESANPCSSITAKDTTLVMTYAG